jgi:hypothetical protein
MISKKIAILTENSFWLSNATNLKHSVIGIRLRNSLDHPYVNFEYPYQLVINFYSPGVSYFADQTQFMGGIDVKGNISYQYGWEGYFLNNNTIYWKNDGSIWTRVQPARNLFNNQYDATSIYNKEKAMTSFISDRVQAAYPVKPGLPGL